MASVIQGFFTDYQQDKWLNQLFKGTAYTPPVTLYVGLSKGAAFRDGTITEVSGGSYARVTCASSVWNTSSGGILTNAGAITFPAATAGWGTVLSIFIADALTAGNVIAMASINPAAISTGNTASLAIGALRISRA